MNAPLPPDAVAIPTLPLDQICPSPYNRKRFDEQALQELAESIKSRGVIQPITVRPNPKGAPLYELVVGERRWRAAQMAGQTDIPAFWRDLDDQTAIEMQAIENLQREDVHPIEEAESFELLMQARDGHPGYKVEDIAAKIGMSRSYVYAALKLLALCPEARDAFFEKKFEASIALLIARIPSKALQKKAMERIIEGDYSGPLSYRRALDYIRRDLMISLKQATFSLTDIDLLPAAGACINCKKCTGNDPMLFGDIEDTDVCTDTKCFEEKRQARHAQLIAQAEADQVPVLRGEQAKEVMPSGTWSLKADKYVDLDKACDDDPEERSYREILGEAAPVSAVIEYQRHDGKVDVMTVADPTALAKALEKAGFNPQRDETPEQKRQGEEAEARMRFRAEQNAKNNKLAETETAFRAALVKRITEEMQASPFEGNDEAMSITRAIAIAAFHREASYADPSEEALAAIGHELPEAYDEDEEHAKILDRLKAAEPEQHLLYLMLHLAHDETREVDAWDFEDEDKPPTCPILNTFAELVGIDVAALRAKFQSQRAPAEPGLEPRPDARYALWGSNGWQTWSGKGKKPAWVTQWLANGKTLEDLEAQKDDPLPAETAPDAGPAAQAQEQGAREPAAPAKAKAAKGAKSPKAKTTPAPATPSNEPAAGVETSASGDAAPVKTERQAWPFPTGSRP